MDYRAVGNRCAVVIESLRLPVSREAILEMLKRKGFIVREVDMIGLARKCVGTSTYRRGARLSEAPAVVDCSSFMKWLYAMRGIWLPRRSIQQRKLGEAIPLDALHAGDLVFVSGRVDYYMDDPADGVGHVGIATGENTVIHAANKRSNVVETPLDAFVGKNKFRGVRRYIPRQAEVITLETPAGREVELADDLRWIVLQSLAPR